MIGDFKNYTQIIVGLIIGGIIAAPLGAYLCKKIPVKLMLGLVGVLVVILNTYKLLKHTGVI